MESGRCVVAGRGLSLGASFFARVRVGWLTRRLPDLVCFPGEFMERLLWNRLSVSQAMGKLLGLTPCVTALATFAVVAGGVVRAENDVAPPSPQISVCLIHPDRLAAAGIRLFQGTRAAHPAAALAAWKRATADPNQLGKTLEAVIALGNPEMVREWRVFHEAELRYRLDPETGWGGWRLSIPRDDGTVASLITALRVSGGETEAGAIDGFGTVERLGGAGSMVAAWGGRGVVLASARDELTMGGSGSQAVLSGSGVRGVSPADRRSEGVSLSAPEFGGAVEFRIEPGKVGSAGGVPGLARQGVAAAQALEIAAVEGMLQLVGDSLRLEVVSRPERGAAVVDPLAEATPIDPRWLSAVCESDAVAVVAVGLGRSAAWWDRAFRVADAIDRALPERAGLAPLRTRLTLLGTALGTNFEADLWPRLRGLTACVLAERRDPRRSVRGWVCLHTDTAESARRLVEELIPRLARRLGLAGPVAGGGGQGPNSEIGPGRLRPMVLGRFSGELLELAAQGPDVFLGWGEGTVARAVDSADRRQGSVMPRLMDGWLNPKGHAPHRVAAFWPGRVAWPVPALAGDSPLIRSLAAGPPVVWHGWNEAEGPRELLRWESLGALVARFLDSIPLDPVAAP